MNYTKDTVNSVIDSGNRINNDKADLYKRNGHYDIIRFKAK